MAKNTVIVALIAALTITLAASQAPKSELFRFGRVGDALTAAEVAEITDLATPTGKRPWLLLGPLSMMRGHESASLFLEPEVIGARVQRGRMMRLAVQRPPVVQVRSAWRIEGERPYAYIPTQGRPPRTINGESDIDWPFALEGEFDDDTLISIVEFIRSKPRITMPAFRKEVSGAPISGIARRDDAIVVALRTGDLTGDRVWLARKNGQWVITKHESWIA